MMSTQKSLQSEILPEDVSHSEILPVIGISHNHNLTKVERSPSARKKWIGIAALGVVLLGTAVAFSSNANRGILVAPSVVTPVIAPKPVLAVTVAPAAVNCIDRHVSVNGSVSAWDPVSVSAEDGGLQVSSILVDEGAKVKKGQVLAILDSSLIKPQLDSELALLQSSIASGKKAAQPNRPEDINGLSAAVSQAQATVEDQESALIQAQASLSDANNNLNRYMALQRDGAVSMQELETRQTTAKVTAANMRSAEKKITAAKYALKQAQERLSMAKIGGRREDIQMADAATAQVQANIRRLRAQLDHTFVKAPVDGVIVKRDAHIGDITIAGKSMFSMARDNRLELRAQVPETDLAVLKNGQSVTITSALTVGHALNGYLREVSPQIENDTRLATVRIDIPTSNVVKPGMYAEGRIDVGQSAVLTVPNLAVISQDDKSVVFVLHNTTVEARTVTTGTRTDDLVEIQAGLHPGDKVVVKGAGFLKDGDCVSLASTK